MATAEEHGGKLSDPNPADEQANYKKLLEEGGEIKNVMIGGIHQPAPPPGSVSISQQQRARYKEHIADMTNHVQNIWNTRARLAIMDENAPGMNEEFSEAQVQPFARSEEMGSSPYAVSLEKVILQASPNAKPQHGISPRCYPRHHVSLQVDLLPKPSRMSHGTQTGEDENVSPSLIMKVLPVEETKTISTTSPDGAHGALISTATEHVKKGCASSSPPALRSESAGGMGDAEAAMLQIQNNNNVEKGGPSVSSSVQFPRIISTTSPRGGLSNSQYQKNPVWFTSQSCEAQARGGHWSATPNAVKPYQRHQTPQMVPIAIPVIEAPKGVAVRQTSFPKNGGVQGPLPQGVKVAEAQNRMYALIEDHRVQSEALLKSMNDMQVDLLAQYNMKLKEQERFWMEHIHNLESEVKQLKQQRATMAVLLAPEKPRGGQKEQSHRTEMNNDTIGTSSKDESVAHNLETTGDYSLSGAHSSSLTQDEVTQLLNTLDKLDHANHPAARQIFRHVTRLHKRFAVPTATKEVQAPDSEDVLITPTSDELRQALISLLSRKSDIVDLMVGHPTLQEQKFTKKDLELLKALNQGGAPPVPQSSYSSMTARAGFQGSKPMISKHKVRRF